MGAPATWTSSAVDSVIVAADANRDTLFIQRYSGHVVNLGIGTTAVKTKGIRLSLVNDSILLRGWAARQAIHAINDTAEATVGAAQDGDVTFMPGSPGS